MSGLKPLGPTFPVNPSRPVKDEAERRRREARRKRPPGKDQKGPRGKVDEYA